jgi:hypothetical protein
MRSPRLTTFSRARSQSELDPLLDHASRGGAAKASFQLLGALSSTHVEPRSRPSTATTSDSPALSPPCERRCLSEWFRSMYCRPRG